MALKLFLHLQDFSAQMKKQNIGTYAASTAFFFFLSVVPMLIMICTIIPYTPLTEEILVEAVTDLTPDQADPLVKSLISEVYSKSAGILSIAIITTIWSAAKGVMALMRGLNAINGVEDERNYFVVRVVASFYTVVMLVVVILSLFVMVLGDQLVALALHRLPDRGVLCHEFSLSSGVGGPDNAVRGDLCLCARQKAALQGAGARSGFFRCDMEYLLLGVFQLSELQQFLWYLREPVHYYHTAAVDVLLYVHHFDRGLPEPVF